jgi:hypothetical protein
MLPSVYQPPTIPVPPVVIRTGWCLPGLLGYAVYTPPPRRVPQEERETERERLRQEARRRQLAVATVATAVAVVAGRALWKHFWRVVAERFAVRLGVAVVLAAVDGPLPFGELLDAGLAVVTIAQIAIEWDELWRKAGLLAGTQAEVTRNPFRRRVSFETATAKREHGRKPCPPAAARARRCSGGSRTGWSRQRRAGTGSR